MRSYEKWTIGGDSGYSGWGRNLWALEPLKKLKEKLQAEVDKVIEHFRKEEDAEEAYKARAPERKAAKAKYDAQKRKDELAKSDELYGNGTWSRVTYMQRGGDDGYSYVVRVDGKPCTTV